LACHLNLEPSEAVGWDGFLYPWTFSVHDFEPITGRIHQPPPLCLWIAVRELTRPGDDRRCHAAFA
jgi:homogentisate 1,2-dioxygenase